MLQEMRGRLQPEGGIPGASEEGAAGSGGNGGFADLFSNLRKAKEERESGEARGARGGGQGESVGLSPEARLLRRRAEVRDQASRLWARAEVARAELSKARGFA